MPPELPKLLDTAHGRHQAGDLAEASRLYHEILRHDPLQPDALHMLGVIARQQGNNELALKLIEVALGQRSTMPLAWHNRSVILRILGRNDEALQSAEQAVALDPNLPHVWDMIGFLLRGKGDFKRAREAYGRALAILPDDDKLLGNYALLLLAMGELAEAYSVMRGIEKRGSHASVHTMGNILKAAGYTDLALPYYRISREQMSENVDLSTVEAMAHLQIGDFAEGWRLWETRPSLDTRFAPVPFWTGEPVEHLLLHEDQGMGDAFQCVRYIPELRRFAKKITIAITRPLRKIFEISFPDCPVINLDDPVPAVDARIRMLSLPAFFGMTAETVPAATPYLKTKDEWRAPWRERLAARPKPRLGLVWGGNPGHLNDSLRSVATHDLLPLLQNFGAHIVSLQKGIQKSGADLAEHGVFDADPFLNDFADTAGLMQELDLLITVDTSVAHLAGALGRPVWLLLPFDPDWRWLLEREDSPWYPSMRLYRQKSPRSWPEVITRMNADLKKLMSGDATVLRPAPWRGGYAKRNPQAIALPGLQDS